MGTPGFNVDPLTINEGMEDFFILYSYFEKINQRELSLLEKEEIRTEFKKESFKKKQLIFSESGCCRRVSSLYCSGIWAVS